MRRVSGIVLFALAALWNGPFLRAEEEEFDFEVSEADAPSPPAAVSLGSRGTEIGGTFRFRTSSAWDADGAWGAWEAADMEDAFALDLGANAFLDARPSDVFRVFAKIDVSWPFTENGTRGFDDVFRVRELFSDFQYGDSLFFRAGKQNLGWGVGRFFSPADILNVEEVDPEDPDAEREGPVALKAQAPMGPHNISLYAVFDDALAVEDTALASRVELLLGDVEIGLGGFWQRERSPMGVLTGTTNLGDFHLFAEGTLSWGSARTFVVEDAAAASGIATASYAEGLFPSATAGLTWNHDDPEDLFSLSLSAQYLYNGWGHTDDLLARNSAAVLALAVRGQLAVSDLVGACGHYAAAGFTWRGMLGTDLKPSLLWIGNLSDGSGRLAAAMGWEPADEWGLSVKAGWRYGPEGAEYAPRGEGFSFTVTASMGEGGF